MKKIFVDSTALRRILTALVGPPHHIRELQATRDRPPILIGNPIDALIKEYDTQVVGATPDAETEFYLQDSRQYVGNDMLFWKADGNGYTTNLAEAQIYTKEAAQAQHNMRHSDIPWPRSYIDRRLRPVVDMQTARLDKAIEGTGLVITKEKPASKERLRCPRCQRFLSVRDFWLRGCPSCHTDQP